MRDHVVRTGFQRHLHHFVFQGARRKDQLATVLELKRHGPFGAHVAAVFAKSVANLGHSAHLVVGHGVQDDGRAANAVALIADFLVVHPFLVAGGLVDVVLDTVRRHVGGLGSLHGQAQTRVGRQVTATRAGGYCNFADDARPDLAPFFVLPAFSVLNIGPFTVSCHKISFKNSLRYWLNCTFWDSHV